MSAPPTTGNGLVTIGTTLTLADLVARAPTRPPVT